MPIPRSIVFPCALALALALFPPAPARAANAMLLWPLYQVIEADQSGSALWLENRSKDASHVQIRVYAWDQSDFQDRYVAQQQVLASPPFSTIAAGQRQLIRLMRLAPVPPGEERAFRIIIDEIQPQQAPEGKDGSIGLKFQMRYSVPLFLDGEGIWTKQQARKPRSPDAASQPVLDWKIAEVDGQRYLEVSNSGVVHARLSNVYWEAESGKQLQLAAGLLGYVLAGKQMRWPIKNLPVTERMPLKLQLADGVLPTEVKHR